MTPFSILYVLAMMAYALLALRLLARYPRSLPSWTGAAFLLSLALWSLEDVFHGSPASTLAQVVLFSDIGNVGRASFASLFVLFTLAQTGNRRMLRHPAVWLALALPPGGFLWTLWTGRFLAENVSYPFGWGVAWPWTAWSIAFYAYCLLYMLFGTVVLLGFRHSTPNPVARTNAGLVAGTTGLSVVLGMTTDVVLPYLTSVEFPGLAVFAGLGSAFGLYYGVARHGLTPVTP